MDELLRSLMDAIDDIQESGAMLRVESRGDDGYDVEVKGRTPAVLLH